MAKDPTQHATPSFDAHDTSALDDAYREHGAHVHALARGLCGASLADGLTQEVFLELWNDPQLLHADRGTLRSALLARAHRRAVDVLRSDTTRASGAGTLAILEQAELNELFNALPVDERHPIVLAYFGGHTYREVARLLAVPEGTIKSRIRSGLRRMRQHGQPQLDPG